MADWKQVPGFEDVLYEKRDDGVARITINRPDVLNALRTQTYEELARAFRDAGEDPTIGVVVLTGAGERAFSSGGDVRYQRERTADSARVHLSRTLELGMVMRNLGKPIIAAVRGYAVGGGHELHLWCEAGGATQWLPIMIGDRRAREMLFLCRQYDAREAERMGLVNAVVPLEKLEEEVEAWCQEILDKSPTCLRIAKIALNHASDGDFYPSYVHEAELLALFTGTEEQREGQRAFLEKRKPDYRQYRRRVPPGA
ncbi:MAG: enoyl-CoA hydratase/isomerase family protein [Chloroflexi bacterium]|nr:enoyl-CoA hydratase/isomerase family protein [Chloroflexota bacterium]